MVDNEGADAPNEADSGEEQVPDPINNLKAEYGRKFDNLNQTLAQQTAQLNALMETLTQKQANGNATQVDKKKLADLVYENPEEYARIVRDEAVNSAREVITQESQRASATTQVLNTLTNEYPELRDQSSELYKTAIATYNNLPNYLKNTPEGFKTAIRDAAADLGVQSSKHRKTKASDNDDFLGGSSGNTTTRTPKKADIEDGVLIWADALGLDVKSKEVQARLKEHSKRDFKKWSK